MAASSPPRHETEIRFFSPWSAFVKMTVWVPAGPGRATSGVLPSGFPSSTTNEAGSELILRKPSPPEESRARVGGRCGPECHAAGFGAIAAVSRGAALGPRAEGGAAAAAAPDLGSRAILKVFSATPSSKLIVCR